MKSYVLALCLVSSVGLNAAYQSLEYDDDQPLVGEDVGAPTGEGYRAGKKVSKLLRSYQWSEDRLQIPPILERLSAQELKYALGYRDSKGQTLAEKAESNGYWGFVLYFGSLGARLSRHAISQLIARRPYKKWDAGPGARANNAIMLVLLKQIEINPEIINVQFGKTQITIPMLMLANNFQDYAIEALTMTDHDYTLIDKDRWSLATYASRYAKAETIKVMSELPYGDDLMKAMQENTFNGRMALKRNPDALPYVAIGPKEAFDFFKQNPIDQLVQPSQKTKAKEIARAYLRSAKNHADLLRAPLTPSGQELPRVLANLEMYEELVELIDTDGFDSNMILKTGETIAIHLLKKGLKDLTIDLVQREDFEPNRFDSDGKTLLMWSIIRGERDLVKELLENPQTDIHIQSNKEGWTALLLASRYMPTLMETLLKSGVDSSVTTSQGKSMIDLSMESRSIYGLALSLSTQPGLASQAQTASVPRIREDSLPADPTHIGSEHKWEASKNYLLQLPQREQANFAFLYSKILHLKDLDDVVEVIRFSKENRVIAHIPTLFYIHEIHILKILQDPAAQEYFAKITRDYELRLIGRLGQIAGTQFNPASQLNQLRDKFDSTRLLGDLSELQ